MIPYKSKFQEATLKESYDMDAFNAFLEKEVPGFGGPGPEDKAKANEYYRQMIKTLESYIGENELPRRIPPHSYYKENPDRYTVTGD